MKIMHIQKGGGVFFFILLLFFLQLNVVVDMDIPVYELVVVHIRK